MKRSAALLATVGLSVLLVPASASAATTAPTMGVAATPSGSGQWTVTADGTVRTGGDAAFLGDLQGHHLNRPIVAIAATPSGAGYWLTASDGGIFSFGDAGFHGSTGGYRLNQPIVGMASTPTGNGYWLTASDGGIFSFGDAAFYGSTGRIRLNQPIVSMAASTSGRGYWLVARDGGIFSFGDAGFYGSTGRIRLNQPIVGMAASTSGRGYWLVAADGGAFTFGDARYLGSTGGKALGAPIVGVASGKAGGYRLAGRDGAVFAFGTGSAPRTTTAPPAGADPAATPTSAPASSGGSSSGGGGGGGGGGSSSPVTTAPTTTTPPTPAAAQRVAALWPFSSTSPWNTPLGTGAAFAPATDARNVSLQDVRSVTWMNAGQYSHPIYQASASDPVATFRRPGFADVSYRVPADARPAGGDDKHLHVVDPTGHYVDESWATGGTFPTFTTGYHVRTDLYGPGVGEGGVRAYGGSAIGGLIRSWEVDKGEIRHALAIAVSGFQLAQGPVWPATSEDGDATWSYTGALHMGSLVAIPDSVDVTRLGLTPEGLMLARTLQDFGAYVVDRSGATTLYAEPSLEPTPAMAALRGDFARLRTALRVVTNNSPSTVGGPGDRRAPLAPPLG